MEKRELIKAYIAWAAVSFFWGTTYIAIRVGVEVLPPALFAGLRFLFAGLIFIPILKLKGYDFPKPKELKDIAIVGIALLVIANGTVVWSEQWVPSGLTSLIVATLPFFMVGFEAALPRGEKLNLRKVAGILIGFVGLAILLLPDLQGTIDSAYLKGILVLLIAPISWGAGSVFSKYRKIKTSPLMAAAFQMLIAGVVLTLIGAVIGEFQKFTFSFQGIAALVYLLVFGSIVGFSAYIYALAKLPTAFVSTYAYINPVIAVLLGWLFLGERLDWMMALAAILILLGVVLAKSAASKKRAIQSEPINRQKIKETKEFAEDAG